MSFQTMLYVLLTYTLQGVVESLTHTIVLQVISGSFETEDSQLVVNSIVRQMIDSFITSASDSIDLCDYCDSKCTIMIVKVNQALLRQLGSTVETEYLERNPQDL